MGKGVGGGLSICTLPGNFKTKNKHMCAYKKMRMRRRNDNDDDMAKENRLSHFSPSTAYYTLMYEVHRTIIKKRINKFMFPVL